MISSGVARLAALTGELFFAVNDARYVRLVALTCGDVRRNRTRASFLTKTKTGG